MSGEPSPPEASSLEEYVAERGLELDDLAMLSGVDSHAVRRISDGTAAGDVSHVAAIQMALPGTPERLLNRHSVPKPDALVTRKGSLPEGCEFRFMKAEDLRAGDLIAYLPRTLHSRGSHWLEVGEDPDDNGIWVHFVAGGVDVWAKKDQAVRAARPLDQ